ncbi:unnamed protein product [Amoebophrya sp. A120]|nr:unnamed protein product [Amoebophrya sp. A120]|eukprot:GSA120T00016012001.1
MGAKVSTGERKAHDRGRAIAPMKSPKGVNLATSMLDDDKNDTTAGAAVLKTAPPPLEPGHVLNKPVELTAGGVKTKQQPQPDSASKQTNSTASTASSPHVIEDFSVSAASGPHEQEGAATAPNKTKIGTKVEPTKTMTSTRPVNIGPRKDRYEISPNEQTQLTYAELEDKNADYDPNDPQAESRRKFKKDRSMLSQTYSVVKNPGLVSEEQKDVVKQKVEEYEQVEKFLAKKAGKSLAELDGRQPYAGSPDKSSDGTNSPSPLKPNKFGSQPVPPTQLEQQFRERVLIEDQQKKHKMLEARLKAEQVAQEQKDSIKQQWLENHWKNVNLPEELIEGNEPLIKLFTKEDNEDLDAGIYEDEDLSPRQRKIKPKPKTNLHIDADEPSPQSKVPSADDILNKVYAKKSPKNQPNSKTSTSAKQRVMNNKRRPLDPGTDSSEDKSDSETEEPTLNLEKSGALRTNLAAPPPLPSFPQTIGNKEAKTLRTVYNTGQVGGAQNMQGGGAAPTAANVTTGAPSSGNSANYQGFPQFASAARKSEAPSSSILRQKAVDSTASPDGARTTKARSPSGKKKEKDGSSKADPSKRVSFDESNNEEFSPASSVYNRTRNARAGRFGTGGDILSPEKNKLQQQMRGSFSESGAADGAASSTTTGTSNNQHLFHSNPSKISINARRVLFAWLKRTRRHARRTEEIALAQKRITKLERKQQQLREKNAGTSSSITSAAKGAGGAGGPEENETANYKPSKFKPAKRRKLLRIDRYLDDWEELDRLAMADPVKLIKSHLERVTYKLNHGEDPRFDLLGHHDAAKRVLNEHNQMEFYSVDSNQQEYAEHPLDKPRVGSKKDDDIINEAELTRNLARIRREKEKRANQSDSDVESDEEWMKRREERKLKRQKDLEEKNRTGLGEADVSSPLLSPTSKIPIEFQPTFAERFDEQLLKQSELKKRRRDQHKLSAVKAQTIWQQELEQERQKAVLLKKQEEEQRENLKLEKKRLEELLKRIESGKENMRLSGLKFGADWIRGSSSSKGTSSSTSKDLLSASVLSVSASASSSQGGGVFLSGSYTSSSHVDDRFDQSVKSQSDGGNLMDLLPTFLQNQKKQQDHDQRASSAGPQPPQSTGPTTVPKLPAKPPPNVAQTTKLSPRTGAAFLEAKTQDYSPRTAGGADPLSASVQSTQRRLNASHNVNVLEQQLQLQSQLSEAGGDIGTSMMNATGLSIAAQAQSNFWERMQYVKADQQLLAKEMERRKLKEQQEMKRRKEMEKQLLKEHEEQEKKLEAERKQIRDNIALELKKMEERRKQLVLERTGGGSSTNTGGAQLANTKSSNLSPLSPVLEHQSANQDDHVGENKTSAKTYEETFELDPVAEKDKSVDTTNLAKANKGLLHSTTSATSMESVQKPATAVVPGLIPATASAASASYDYLTSSPTAKQEEKAAIAAISSQLMKNSQSCNLDIIPENINFGQVGADQLNKTSDTPIISHDSAAVAGDMISRSSPTSPEIDPVTGRLLKTNIHLSSLSSPGSSFINDAVGHDSSIENIEQSVKKQASKLHELEEQSELLRRDAAKKAFDLFDQTDVFEQTDFFDQSLPTINSEAALLELDDDDESVLDYDEETGVCFSPNTTALGTMGLAVTVDQDARAGTLDDHGTSLTLLPGAAVAIVSPSNEGSSATDANTSSTTTAEGAGSKSSSNNSNEQAILLGRNPSSSNSPQPSPNTMTSSNFNPFEQSQQSSGMTVGTALAFENEERKSRNSSRPGTTKSAATMQDKLDQSIGTQFSKTDGSSVGGIFKLLGGDDHDEDEDDDILAAIYDPHHRSRQEMNEAEEEGGYNVDGAEGQDWSDEAETTLGDILRASKNDLLDPPQSPTANKFQPHSPKKLSPEQLRSAKLLDEELQASGLKQSRRNSTISSTTSSPDGKLGALTKDERERLKIKKKHEEKLQMEERISICCKRCIALEQTNFDMQSRMTVPFFYA